MTEEDRKKFKIEISKPEDIDSWDKFYIKCIEVRNFEISNLVSRNNFFMIFQGVIIAGLMQSSGSSPPIIQFLAGVIGIFISIFQFGTASGAKYWQEIWEEELSEAEKRLHMLFDEHKPNLYFTKVFQKDKNKNDAYFKSRVDDCLGNILIRKFSVSRTPIYSSIAFFVFWLLVTASTIDFNLFNLKEILDFKYIVGFKKNE